MPGAGSNRINEFGFYTNYYTLPEEIPLIADALIRTVLVAYENGQLLLEDLIEKVTDTVILYTNYGDLTPEEIIEKDKKGSVYNEFPGQWLGKPLREIEEAARNGDSAAKKQKNY